MDYSCLICQKQCTSASALRSHVKVHTVDYGHFCGNCGRNYASFQAFDEHTKIRIDPYLDASYQVCSLDNLFQCEVCGLVYKLEVSLIGHHRKHAWCICGKGFLTEEEKITHQTGWFTCYGRQEKENGEEY